MSDKNFVYSHYLQAGVKAAEWADENLAQRVENKDPLPLDLGVKLPLEAGGKWRFRFQIDSFTIIDPELGDPIGTVRWHPDGFWVFEPILEKLGSVR